MKHEVHNVDCLDFLPTLPDGVAHAVIMDPPYTAAGGSTNGRTGVADTQFFEHWMRDVAREIRRVVRPDGCGFVFCDWRTAHVIASAFRAQANRMRGADWSASQMLVWDRDAIGLGAPFRNAYEMIAFVRGPDWKSNLPRDIPTVIRHRWTYTAREYHGAEKPVALCRQLVRWALPNGGTVLDPFAGSGTVGVACKAESRSYIGMEINADDHATAQRRIAESLGL